MPGISSHNEGAADQGLPAPVANAWPTIITDGVNTVGVTDDKLNVTLSGNNKVGIIDYVRNFDVIATTFGELRTAETLQLIGGNFFVSPLDTLIWQATLANGGTQSVTSGEINLKTNTTANGSVIINTIRNAIFLSGSANDFIAGVRLPDTGTVDNKRRWGLFNTTEGMFFQLNGTTPELIIRKNSVDTTISSGSFNNTFIVDTNYHVYEIFYTQGSFYFVQDKILIYKATPTTTVLTSTLLLPVRFENVNINGSATNVEMFARSGLVVRMGVGSIDSAQSLLTSSINTFTEEYTSTGAGVIAPTILLTPPTNQRIVVKGISLISEIKTGMLQVDFLTSGIKVFRLYPVTNARGEQGEMKIKGAINESLTFQGTSLGSTNRVFVIINYDIE